MKDYSGKMSTSLENCLYFLMAETGPGDVPTQRLSVDVGRQLRLDLHDAGHHRPLCQHSISGQNHVGK